MANLYLRKKTWWCWGYDIDGKRWQASTKQRERGAAELAAREIERRIARDPESRTRSKLTVEKALMLVLDFQAQSNKAAATQRATKYHVEHLLGHIDPKVPLHEVRLADTTAYLKARLAEGASRHTISKELRTLSQAMRRCAKLGVYVAKVDPRHFVPDELGKVYTPRSRWLPFEEYEKLLVALRDRYRPSDINRTDYVVAWCNLGLRKSELFDIQPGDYNHERRELRVRGTKTEGADRLLPVNAAAAEVLERRCKLDKPFPEWMDGNCTRDLRRACERAGIAPVTPNDLRRTFCSWLCQAGVPERVCAELLGHASTLMVRSVYGHLDRRAMSSAVAHLDASRGVTAGVASGVGAGGGERTLEAATGELVLTENAVES